MGVSTRTTCLEVKWNMYYVAKSYSQIWLDPPLDGCHVATLQKWRKKTLLMMIIETIIKIYLHNNHNYKQILHNK